MRMRGSWSWKAAAAAGAPADGEIPDGQTEIAEGSLTLQEAKRKFERRMILGSLDRNAWNVTRAAGELGLERTALHKKIRSHGLEKGGV